MRKGLLAALVFTLVACGGDKATGPQSVAGSYTLRTVNGGNPPSTIYQDTQEKLEVTDGTVVLNANNTWQGTLGVRITNLSTSQVSNLPGLPLSGGTYTLNGGTLTLDDPGDQLSFTGTVSNGTLTVSSDLLASGQLTTLVYSK
jgi:hypothetical protein